MSEIIKYYNHLADSYDEDRFENTYGKFIDKQERNILNQLLTNKNEMILDLACGSGRLLNYATIGVDGSANMVSISKQKYPEKVVHQSDAEHIPVESNSIDTIISFHFFMHLDKEKIDKILAECARILKDKGRIIFDIPSRKRRIFLNFKSNGWHGAYSTTIATLEKNPNFKIQKSFGILFFPIHRFPKFTRKFLAKVDLLFANSFLKEYSSYLIIEFKKNGSN